jgi:lipoprotein Spr
MLASKFRNFIIILFALPMFSMAGRISFLPIDDPSTGFDSVKCHGYSFFIRKGIHLDSCSDLKLYNEVYSWLGVPYRYGGRSKAGTDCSGFASQVYKNVYNIFISGSAGDLYRMLKPVNKSDLREGDLVFFKINHSGISHAGVYLSNNKFIHATSYGRSVTVSDLNEAYYTRYYFSAGRYL